MGSFGVILASVEVVFVAVGEGTVGEGVAAASGVRSGEKCEGNGGK